MPRALFIGLLGLLLAIVVLASIRDEGVLACLAFLALAPVIATWVVTHPKKQPPPAVPTCSFCTKTQAQVRKLVAGPSCMICDECIGLSKEIIIGQDGGLGTTLEIAAHELESVLLRGRLAYAESDRIIRASLVLDASADACRRACTTARQAENLHAALFALASVPAGERTASDELGCAALCLTEGDLDEATERLHALGQRDDLSEADSALLTLHEATLSGLRPESADEELRESCEAADEAMETVGALEEGLSRDALLAEGHRAKARAKVRLGNSAGAIEDARAALALMATAQSHAVLADALEASGDGEGAAGARREALALAHPESFVARQLTPTSEGPFR